MEVSDRAVTTQNWDEIQKFNEPVLQALANFVHGCSEDSATRTLAVTELVISLWQLAGRNASSRIPSILVINGHDLMPNATDTLASKIIAVPSSSGPRIYKEGLFLHGTPEQAPGDMVRSIKTKQKLGKVTPFNANTHRDWEERFFAAQRTGFGYGPKRQYADAWHYDLGLITDRNDEVILSVERAEDRAAFRKDVVGKVERLRQPLGYGARLKIVPKHISLSGSIPASQWDCHFVSALVELRLPLLMLPSLAKESPQVANPSLFDLIASVFPKSFEERIEEPANLIPTPWFERYGQELRQRLSHFSGDYDYTIQKLVRQIFPFCLHLANWCGTLSASSTDEIGAMTKDLCAHVTRGLIWSVAGLAWQGLGIEMGCEKQKGIRVLEYLRKRDPMTKSDLRRGTHIGKEERDQILECLAAENLIRIDGKTVAAATYVEFVECLQSRRDLPEPKNHWAAIEGKSQKAA